MGYFKEFPNLKYIGKILDPNSLDEFVDVKNIFKRAKIREDIKNSVTAFTLYQIEGTERPDQLAKKLYNDPELDWVILLTNNITNLNNQWPLDNNTFYKYLIDKYGSDEELQKVHHFETEEVRDEFNRLVIPKGLVVDDDITQELTSKEDIDTYELESFPNTIQPLSISLNLNQRFDVKMKNGELMEVEVTDIRISNSFLKVLNRNNEFTDVSITNTLVNWPKGWSGNFVVIKRDGEMRIDLEDYVGKVPININRTLFEIVGIEEGGILIPKIIFKRTLVD
jgi:hypothetical protein